MRMLQRRPAPNNGAGPPSLLSSRRHMAPLAHSHDSIARLYTNGLVSLRLSCLYPTQPLEQIQAPAGWRVVWGGELASVWRAEPGARRPTAPLGQPKQALQTHARDHGVPRGGRTCVAFDLNGARDDFDVAALWGGVGWGGVRLWCAGAWAGSSKLGCKHGSPVTSGRVGGARSPRRARCLPTWLLASGTSTVAVEEPPSTDTVDLPSEKE